MNCFWLVHYLLNFFTIVHDLFKIGSELVQNLFITCWWLVYILWQFFHTFCMTCSRDATFFSQLIQELFILLALLNPDLFTTSSHFVHNWNLICILLFPDFLHFFPCSWLVYIFSQFSHKLFMTCLWLVHDLLLVFTTCSWIIHSFFMSHPCLVHNLITICSSICSPFVNVLLITSLCLLHKGSHHKKKTEKFGKNSQIGLTPPLPIGNFRLFWKKIYPPPALGNFSHIFPFFDGFPSNNIYIELSNSQQNINSNWP